jgi:hypothetical protein
MEAEGIPDPGFSSDGQEVTGNEVDGMPPPHDTAVAVDDFGTTAEEMAEGEPLDARIAREEDDVLARVDDQPDETEGGDTPFDQRSGQGVGRLVEPDEGVREDREADLVAEDVGTDLGGYSAEESAMHLEPEV